MKENLDYVMHWCMERGGKRRGRLVQVSKEGKPIGEGIGTAIIENQNDDEVYMYCVSDGRDITIGYVPLKCGLDEVMQETERDLRKLIGILSKEVAA